jgi:hypothetical protein
MLTTTAVATLVGSSQANARFSFRRPGSTAIPIQLCNLDTTNSYTAPSVSYGHAFADGEIPPGGSVSMTDSGGRPVSVQMDAVALWPSRSVRFAVLSHACSETFAPGASVTYTITASLAAPDNTPGAGWGGSPEQTLAANSNFTVRYSGLDANGHTYTVSLNKILAKHCAFPWGKSNPLGGWERTKVGPACMEWHAWQYLVNDQTSRPQGYVRCDMWVKAWTPTGPFEIDVRTSQPNMWNAINANSEQYNVPPGRWATYVLVKNGSTVVQHSGGMGDYRKTNIPNADFNVSTYQITAAAGSLFPQTGVVFTSTVSKLPSGISANTLYWLAYVNGNANPCICTQRSIVSALEQGAWGAWTPSTNYALNQVVSNNNIYYVCVSAGQSGASGGPTGTGNNIIDGTCRWANASIPFTDQGQGTIMAWPVNACFPSSGWTTGDRFGNPLWSGTGQRPPIFPGHDFTYLTTQSKFVPSYNSNAGFQTSGKPVNTYGPNQNYGGILWYQGTTGDGPDDQRIGYVNGWGVTSLYNPSDPYYLYGAIQSALCFSNYPYSYMIDERGGMPFCGNNGPQKDGRPYRNLPGVLPNWAGNNTPGINPKQFGVGNWLPWSAAVQDQNGYCGQYYSDPSHMPAAWQIAYLKTGRPCFLDQGIHMANTNCFMLYITEAQLGSTPFYCIINTNGQLQGRAWAWGLRSLCQALYIAPESHAFQPVLRDYYNDNAAYQALYYTSYVPPEAVALGVLNTLDHGTGQFAPWENSFLFIVVAMEVWRGGLTGRTSGAHWKTLLDYMNGFWQVLGSNGAGSMYYAGLYSFCYSPNAQGLSTAYQTPQQALTATAAITQGLATPYPMGGLCDITGANFPWTCNAYSSIARGAMKMVAVAEPRNTYAKALLNQLVAQTSSVTGVSTLTAGIQWCGSYDGATGNYQTFAIF